MRSLIFLAATLSALTGIFYIVRQLVLFDRIAKSAYRNHRESWVEWGRPIGFFWWPRNEGIAFYGGTTARNALCFQLLFGKTEEVEQTIGKDYHEYRRNSVYLIISFAVFAVCLLLNLAVH